MPFGAANSRRGFEAAGRGRGSAADTGKFPPADPFGPDIWWRAGDWVRRGEYVPMRNRRLVAVGVSGLLCAAVLAGFAPARASTADPVVVAVIDTGLAAGHPEFDYRGPDSNDDQLVAWWDFSDDAEGHLPNPGDLWDPFVREPFDPHGHGTATASMAVGLNRAEEKAPSAFPGGKLAVAKVGSGAKADITGDIPAAFEWAVDTVGADVISMSIGAGFALLGDEALYDAIAYARSSGVFVVVSNGNGFLNAGIPGEPGMLKGYGDSNHVLSVGAADTNGLMVTTDPEVVADYRPMAADNDGGYLKTTGTSFGAPFVAGFGARLISEARAAGRDLEPSEVEDLLKFSARDTAYPPNIEGYGVLDIDRVPSAVAHARRGTAPEPDPVNHAYSTLVRDGVTGLQRG